MGFRRHPARPSSGAHAPNRSGVNRTCTGPLLLSAGVSITAVSKRLDHSSAAIASDLDSHLLEDADRQMADAVQTVLTTPNRSGHTLSTHHPDGQRKGPIGESSTST